MFEEKDKQTTSLKDLIELVERDSIPTNEFTIEDKDPLVILGKLNEVVAYLESLQATINSSDTKANEALTKAKQAIADATQALDVANGIDAKATQALTNAVNAVATANTALNASNTALNTANTALGTANTALNSSNSAVETAESAETKADTAITTANGAKTTAEGIDAKATNALTNSNTAINTANSASSTAIEAKTTAEDALNRVVAGLGTKVFRGNTLLDNLNIAEIEALIAQNTNSINQEATTRANAVKALDDAKVDKVSGKQLSTEDYTTAEKTKLAGLYNYNDAQVKADILALQNKNTEQDTAIDSKISKVSGTNYIPKITSSGITSSGILASSVVYSGDTILGSSSNVVEITLYKDGSNVNKIYLQWGKMTTSSSGTSYFTFPKAFTNSTSYTAVATPHEQSAYAHVNVTNISGSQVRFGLRYEKGLYAEPITWIAIGW